MSTLAIGHGNGHNKLTLRDAIRVEGPFDSFGCNEAHRILRPLRRLKGYRVQANGPRDALGPGAGAQRASMNPILVAKHRENIGSMAVRASESPGRNLDHVGHDRWLTGAFYTHPITREVGKHGAYGWRGVAHLNVHLVAGPAALNGKDPDHPLVRAHWQGSTLVRTVMGDLRLQGYLVILTGDLNMHAGTSRPWSPEGVFGTRWRHKSTGLDWIIYDPLLELGSWRTFRLYDHYGFRASLTARRGR